MPVLLGQIKTLHFPPFTQFNKICQHYLAIGMLIFSSVLGFGKILLYIGIAMVISLPAAFNIARIADRLRGRGNVLPATPDGAIPVEAIHLIGDEVNEAYPKGIDVRNKAQLVVQVFENINAKPPGIGSTLVLGGVYVASLLIAMVASMIFIVAQNSDFKRLMAEMAFAPETAVVVDEIVRLPPGADPTSLSTESALVIDFAEPEEARAAFDELSGELDQDDRLLLLGNTVFVPFDPSIPNEQRDERFDRYEDRSLNVFVATESSPTSIRLTCIAPDAETAQRIETQLIHYLNLNSDLRPVPPWHPDVQLNNEQRLARKTVHNTQQQD